MSVENCFNNLKKGVTMQKLIILFSAISIFSMNQAMSTEYFAGKPEPLTGFEARSARAKAKHFYRCNLEYTL